MRDHNTNIQQKQLATRIGKIRKMLQLAHIESGRARILKCEENESFVALLEYALIEGNV